MSAIVLALVMAAGAGPSSAQFAPAGPPAAASPAARVDGPRVRVAGVVVYAGVADGMFVHAGGDVVALRPTHPIALVPGDQIEGTAVRVDHDGIPVYAQAEVVKVGTAPLPAARRTTPVALTNGPGDWVEFEGVVQEVVANSDHLELQVVSLAWPVAVVGPAASSPMERLVDATVRFRGVRQVIRNPQGVVLTTRVLTPSVSIDDIVAEAPAEPFALPVSSIADIRRQVVQQSREHRVLIRGTVLLKHQALVPGRYVVHVQDATGGIVTEVTDASAFRAGDEILVAGFPAQLFGTPYLAGTVYEHVGTGAPPPPFATSAAELLAGRYSGQLVRVRGTFGNYTKGPNFDLVTMESDGATFTAFLYDWPAHGPLPDLREGSVIELTGATAAGFDTGAPTLVMFLSGPDAIALIQAPSWWTPGRVLAAAAIGLGLVVMALAWVWVLNARVQRQTRALEEQFERTAALQRRWTDLVATASDVIVTWDLRGGILSMNQTGEVLTGITEDAARQLTLKDLVAPQSRDAAAALMGPSPAAVGGNTHELEVLDEDGQAVPLEISVQPMLEDGVHVGYQAIGRNVAAHKRVERALRAARDAAEDANRAKSEFLANMSHEIRTPMNGIIGMTELALTTELTSTQREYLDTVKTSAESLLGLLNGILDFSKIESRKLEMESVPFALRDLMAESLKPLGLKADQKGLELMCDIPSDVPDALIGDPLRLRQIVTNLVSNAIKFTDRGHILLVVKEDRRADNCTRLHFAVSDTGLGISKDKHATIFEPFSQGDGSTTRRYGGTGLGLAISATLVRMMGGRIWVESEPGGGSTFHFTAGFDVTSAVEPAGVEPSLANLPVLVVDDNDVNRRILAEQLARWGMKATLAAGGAAAIEALDAAAGRGEPFLLVLLDANMPGVDGFAVAEHMSQRPDLARATIMMLTSSGEYGDAERCRVLNISAYLTKPIAPKHLLDAMCRVIGRGKAQPHVPKAAVTAKAVPSASRRKVLLAEDNIVNQRVAIGLLSKRGHDVTLATNGIEALEALEHETFDVVLMDVQMPEMGGLEATAEIRRREIGTGRRVRVVAMTAHAMNGDRDQCLSSGMDGYLSKPVDPAMLYAVVEDAPAPASPPADIDRGRPVDGDALRARLGGDEQLFTEVIQSFLDDCPTRLAALKAAVDRRDTHQVRSAAHALKGAAGNLSAASLFAMAQTLEQLGAEHRVDALDGAWRQLSAEAAHVMDTLRRFEVAPRTLTHI